MSLVLFARKCNFGQSPQAGLSIIEVMVILSMLALLAAMLFPLLSRTRYASYNAICVNNLRQFSEAFSLYERDWSGEWPNPGGRLGDFGYWSQSNPNGGLNPYLKQSGDKSVWCCPLMPEWQSRYPPRTYTMNSYLRYIPDVEYPLSIALDKRLMRGISLYKIQRPAKTILLFEGLPLLGKWENSPDPAYVYIYRCCNWTGVKGYYSKVIHDTFQPGKPWHGSKNNYLYCDGHVVARSPGRYSNNERSTYKEMFEWYVDKVYCQKTYQGKVPEE